MGKHTSAQAQHCRKVYLPFYWLLCKSVKKMSTSSSILDLEKGLDSSVFNDQITGKSG